MVQNSEDNIVFNVQKANKKIEYRAIRTPTNAKVGSGDRSHPQWVVVWSLSTQVTLKTSQQVVSEGPMR
jgi:hypothetical protein